LARECGDAYVHNNVVLLCRPTAQSTDQPYENYISLLSSAESDIDDDLQEAIHSSLTEAQEYV